VTLNIQPDCTAPRRLLDRESHGEVPVAVWVMIPHLPVHYAEFPGLCGATWGCCSITTLLVSMSTLSLEGSKKILVGCTTAMCAE
jgi:hypothetical protein